MHGTRNPPCSKIRRGVPLPLERGFQEIPTSIDGHTYRLFFDVGEQQGKEFHATEQYAVNVEVSGTLQAVWNQSDAEIGPTSATSATSAVLALASENRLRDLGTIQLNTYTVPKIPPTQPVVMSGALFPIAETRKPEPIRQALSTLSEDISEFRDQINALSVALWGERLLLLPQERAILDVYKPTTTVEEYRSRVQSLAGICTAINKDLAGKVLKESGTADIGSIILMEQLLTSISTSDKARDVCEPFKHINNLRQGYPTHTDTVEKFMKAHDHFRLDYPVRNFENAWEQILGAYLSSLRQLCDLLSEERRKRIV
jgi:hypothetical protein